MRSGATCPIHLIHANAKNNGSSEPNIFALGAGMAPASPAVLCAFINVLRDIDRQDYPTDRRT